MHAVADFLQVDQSKISRMETAVYPARKPEVLALLDFYNVTDERQRDLMLQLTQDIWRKGWWDEYRADVDLRLADYAWLEARATQINVFEAFTIFGLLQTPDYAKAIITLAAADDSSQEHLERSVQMRLARQRVLTSDEPKQLRAVIDESILFRPVGSAQVLEQQLAHLLEVMKLANVDIRVLPMSVGWHPGYNGQFAVFEMPEPYPDLAYAHNLAGQAYVEESSDVQRFQRAYDELAKSALGPRKSADAIRAAIKELS